MLAETSVLYHASFFRIIEEIELLSLNRVLAEQENRGAN